MLYNIYIIPEIVRKSIVNINTRNSIIILIMFKSIFFVSDSLLYDIRYIGTYTIIAY